MVYCFSCGELLVPGLGCSACRDDRPPIGNPAAEREVRPGRPILTLVKTLPRLSVVEPPPHAAA
jgi:hypothetical protein